MAHPLALQQDPEEDVVRVESELVVLNVTVTDKQRHYVHKLTRPEFKVFEDGREQKVDFFEAEKTPFAAVILMDTSGSMEGSVSDGALRRDKFSRRFARRRRDGDL